jgi:hypothetical protein
MAAGTFREQSGEGTVVETREILAGIAFPCEVECMHHNNYVNFECVLPAQRAEIIGSIDQFLSLTPEAKGRIYSRRSGI